MVEWAGIDLVGRYARQNATTPPLATHSGWSWAEKLACNIYFVPGGQSITVTAAEAISWSSPSCSPKASISKAWIRS